jgi:hypothetical protein
LGGGVNGVETDGDFAFEVATDGVGCQAQSLTRFLVLGTVVVMPGTFWAGSIGLEGVSTPVDEEAEVIYRYIRWGFQTKR